MSLLQHLTDTLKNAGHTVGDWWHTSAAPWLTPFLKSTAKAEIDAAMPIATSLVQSEIAGLVQAAATKDWASFGAKQGDLIAKTGDALEQSGINVAVTSIATAVNLASVSHPDVVAAATPAPELAPVAVP